MGVRRDAEVLDRGVAGEIYIGGLAGVERDDGVAGVDLFDGAVAGAGGSTAASSPSTVSVSFVVFVFFRGCFDGEGFCAGGEGGSVGVNDGLYVVGAGIEVECVGVYFELEGDVGFVSGGSVAVPVAVVVSVGVAVAVVMGSPAFLLGEGDSLCAVCSVSIEVEGGCFGSDVDVDVLEGDVFVGFFDVDVEVDGFGFAVLNGAGVGEVDLDGGGGSAGEDEGCDYEEGCGEADEGSGFLGPLSHGVCVGVVRYKASITELHICIVIMQGV